MENEDISVEERFWKAIFFFTDSLRDNASPFGGISKNWDLTVQQARLLRAVYLLTASAHPDGVMLKTLASALGVTSAAVCGMVDCMVRRGQLIRTRCADNRRSVRIQLSELSYDKVEEMNQIFCKNVHEMIPLLGEDKFREMTRCLEILNSKNTLYDVPHYKQAKEDPEAQCAGSGKV